MTKQIISYPSAKGLPSQPTCRLFETRLPGAPLHDAATSPVAQLEKEEDKPVAEQEKEEDDAAKDIEEG